MSKHTLYIIITILIIYQIIILSYKFCFESFTLLECKKINFISKIAWINLDRSTDRSNYMNNILKDINIKNERISAIDGKFNNVESIVSKLNLNRKLSNTEIACTLSHIKAINSFKNEHGDYFMVCEDDISFSNLVHFRNVDLQKIIKSAPNFDVLLLNKTCRYMDLFQDTYIEWRPIIYSAVCYIVSKEGVKKLTNAAKYISDDKFEFDTNVCDFFDVSDYYIYSILNTWVYKYNFISTSEDQDSTIHNENLDFHKLSNKLNLDLILKNKHLL